jgi:hypothetical protein
MSNRVSGHAYGGRSLADWGSVLHERRQHEIGQTLETLNSVFPPCNGDTLGEWVNNGRNLGLITAAEYVVILAYRSKFGTWFGLR